MLIKTPPAIPESEITDPKLYASRRDFLRTSANLSLLSLFPSLLFSESLLAKQGLGKLRASAYSTKEEPTSFKDITRYNNFYEFGVGKTDPAEKAKHFKTKPWQVAIDGEVEKPGHYDLEDLLRPHPLEERIYRMRCVEAWSMVIPWVGFPLGDLLRRYQPTSRARYVAFETLYDPKRMPGQKRRILDWPYREALRMDEAMHPLTILVVGLYGDTLPNQNGAPLRLVVPWKYGFKSIKSIVRIHLAETQPPTTWSQIGDKEYGFYANVNPEVDHPKWSQKKERRIGDSFLRPKRKTVLFNGYGEQVAHLYKGMDLRENF